MCILRHKYVHISYRVGIGCGPSQVDGEVPIGIFVLSLSGTPHLQVEFNLSIAHGAGTLVDSDTGIVAPTHSFSLISHCGGYRGGVDPNHGMRATMIQFQATRRVFIARPDSDVRRTAQVVLGARWSVRASPLLPPPPQSALYGGSTERAFDVQFFRQH